MAEGGWDRDFMENLLKTGIPGLPWAKKTYLFVVVIENVKKKVVWNKRYQTSCDHVHTEIQMLKDTAFQREVKEVEEGEVNIILTSNYSPCRVCADELTKFFEKKKSFIGKFIIQFSHPYRTNDKSNRDGLKRLKSAGIILEAMTMEYWFSMMTEFVFDLDPDKILERDKKTREKLDELLDEDSERESSDSNVGGLTDKMKKFDI